MAFGWMKMLFRLQKYIVALLFVSFLLGMLLGIALVTNTDFGWGMLTLLRSESGSSRDIADGYSGPKMGDSSLMNKMKAKGSLYKKGLGGLSPLEPLDQNANTLRNMIGNKQNKASRKGVSPVKRITSVSNNVHIFYYPWYSNPKLDEKYFHWNHPYLPHWDKQETDKWPKGSHVPPADLGSNYYPELGPYSSTDPKVIKAHMEQIKGANIGVIVVSWYPPSQADDNGKPGQPDKLMPVLLNAASGHGLKVAFHIEPYKNRNVVNMKENIKYIIKTYGSHKAFYRISHKGHNLPLFYVYDSYMISAKNWSSLLRPGGMDTVRNSIYDGVFIGLLADHKHVTDLSQAGFDGMYTYFATEGFTYGSSIKNWKEIAANAKSNRMMFIPSVGPGYIDTQVRPWNGQNSRPRNNGVRYEQSFKTALSVNPNIISITSFNEWHEGTQIEKAVPKKTKQFEYLDYLPNEPDFYLKLTRKWVRQYMKQRLLVGSRSPN